jgi:hypothetical protein
MCGEGKAWHFATWCDVVAAEVRVVRCRVRAWDGEVRQCAVRDAIAWQDRENTTHLHLEENHAGNFLWLESLCLTHELDLDHGLVLVADDLEWPVLHVFLHCRVAEIAPDQPLGVKDAVGRVHRDLRAA